MTDHERRMALIARVREAQHRFELNGLMIDLGLTQEQRRGVMAHVASGYWTVEEAGRRVVSAIEAEAVTA